MARARLAARRDRGALLVVVAFKDRMQRGNIAIPNRLASTIRMNKAI